MNVVWPDNASRQEPSDYPPILVLGGHLLQKMHFSSWPPSAPENSSALGLLDPNAWSNDSGSPIDRAGRFTAELIREAVQTPQLASSRSGEPDWSPRRTGAEPDELTEAERAELDETVDSQGSKLEARLAKVVDELFELTGTDPDVGFTEDGVRQAMMGLYRQQCTLTWGPLPNAEPSHEQPSLDDMEEKIEGFCEKMLMCGQDTQCTLFGPSVTVDCLAGIATTTETTALQRKR